MSELRFYGASDDLVEVDGVFREEYTLPSSDFLDFEVIHDDGQGSLEGCRVRVRYTALGTWAVEVSKLYEGFPIVWPIRIEEPPFAEEYSVAVVLDVPDHVQVIPALKEDER